VKIDPPLELSRRDRPAQAPTSEGGGRTPLPMIMEVMEFQMVSMEES
jgi:hypothetical protein